MSFSVENYLSLLGSDTIISRRQFLRLTLAVGSDFLLPSERITPAELLKLPPNFNLPAVGYSIVPEDLTSHCQDESVIMTMNFGDLDMGIYGEGFMKARGLKTLKIEQYPKDRKLRPEEWKNYITQVILRYQGIKRAIIGNECNSRILESYLPPKEYVSVYETAYQVIKDFSPQTIVSLYGEAYDDYETRSYLEEVLRILKSQGFRPDEGSTHFYDHPKKFKSWLEGYQNTLNEFFGYVPIHISEMGKQISIPVSDEQHASLMVQDLALAAAYVEQRKISFAAWFAAATFKENQSDSIFRFSETVNGKLEPSHLVIPWYLVTKALHHDIKLTEGRGIIIVNGRNANDQPSLLVWNKTSQLLPYQVPANLSAYDLYGKEISPRNDVIFLPPTNYPNICFGKPVFFF